MYFLSFKAITIYNMYVFLSKSQTTRLSYSNKSKQRVAYTKKNGNITMFPSSYLLNVCYTQRNNGTSWR